MSSNIYFFYIFIFYLGTILGSFANVCIYRLPLEKGVITGRSFCPKCKRKILWHDNLPIVSYWFLGRKCRNCKKRISLQYFIVELISGLVLLYFVASLNDYIDVFIIYIIFFIFLMIFFIDLKHFLIPDILNFTLIIIAFLKNFIPNLSINLNQDMGETLLGGVLGYSIIWLIIISYKKIRHMEAMGLGDAKLMAGIGLLFGWKSVPFVLFVSAILGLLMVLPSLVEKKKSLKSEIPFGPYIITAGIIYFLYGDILYQIVLGI